MWWVYFFKLKQPVSYLLFLLSVIWECLLAEVCTTASLVIVLIMIIKIILIISIIIPISPYSRSILGLFGTPFLYLPCRFAVFSFVSELIFTV